MFTSYLKLLKVLYLSTPDYHLTVYIFSMFLLPPQINLAPTKNDFPHIFSDTEP